MSVTELIEKLQELDGEKTITITAITSGGNMDCDIKSSDIIFEDNEYCILIG